MRTRTEAFWRPSRSAARRGPARWSTSRLAPAASAAATFSNVDVSTVYEPRWTASDIGDVGRTGTWSGTAARLRVRGAGADIWDRADAFNFVANSCGE